MGKDKHYTVACLLVILNRKVGKGLSQEFTGWIKACGAGSNLRQGVRGGFTKKAFRLGSE